MEVRQSYEYRLFLGVCPWEREENLLEIASEKSRLKAIIETITDGVIIVNKIGEVVYFNHAALKLLDIDELKIGEEVLEKIPNKISDQVKEYIKSDKLIHKSNSQQIEIKPTNELFVEAACYPIPQPDGSFAGVLLVLNNITEFKRIEIIKNQFVSMVAHELKAPVAAVQGFLKLILDKDIQITKEQEEDYISRSSTRLDGLLALVNDLLDSSRMELKAKQREIAELDVKQIMKSTIELMEVELKNRGIELSTNIENNIPHLMADHNEISRLITNILSNAIKYNKDNGKIFVNVSSSQNYLKIKIEDTGIGIKHEEQEKLFHEFFRAKNKHTKKVSGTGLGLTIVKRIVDSYHGRIEVESEYGIGSTFKIYLPINSQLIGEKNGTNRDY